MGSGKGDIDLILWSRKSGAGNLVPNQLPKLIFEPKSLLSGENKDSFTHLFCTSVFTTFFDKVRLKILIVLSRKSDAVFIEN